MVAAIAIFPLLAEAGAIDQLHQFLNSTRTLKADFSQIVVGKGGRKPQQSSGSVAIARPGKLRWDIGDATSLTFQTVHNDYFDYDSPSITAEVERPVSVRRTGIS